MGNCRNPSLGLAIKARAYEGANQEWNLGVTFHVHGSVGECEGMNPQCRNPSLGLATKARVCKGAAQEWAQESHFMLQGVQESVREWTPTFPSELSLWELESQWISKSSQGNCRCQNSLNSKVPHIIENLLELRYLKWACMTHLDS
jgi:hypothetical protein